MGLLQFLQKKSRVPSDSIKIFETSWSQSSKEISEVRHNVFVVEQSVPSEIEMDGKDSDCIHFLALEKSKPIGAARLQKYGKIERVSVCLLYTSDVADDSLRVDRGGGGTSTIKNKRHAQRVLACAAHQNRVGPEGWQIRNNSDSQ